MTGSYDRLRFRVMLADGTVLVDEVVYGDDLPEAPLRHRRIAEPHLAAGRHVIIETVDPDGIIPTFVLRIPPGTS